MLSARLAPSFVKYAQLRYASYHPVLMQSISATKLTKWPESQEPNQFAATSFGRAAIAMPRPSSFIGRSYSSNQPTLPTKSEIEKVFFKVTVVIWDLFWKITMWAWAMFKKHLILNPTVQSYWKTFNQKLEEARKN